MRRDGVMPTQQPGRPTTRPPASASATPSARPVTTPAPSLERQLAALRHQHAALTTDNTILLRERDAAILATTDHKLALKTAQREAEVAAATLRAEITTLRAELVRTRTALDHALHPAPPPRFPLAAALAARGLEPGEYIQALTLLAASESAAALLEQLEARDPTVLAAIMERRLALVCNDAACAPDLGALGLVVPRARCEVCSGSDIQRAAHGFARACQTAGITRVRFVGGSPNYRTKLAALFPAGGPLRVRTTAGDQRIRLSRSKSQQRGDDLVIIWGASELDHATSGAYRAEYGRTEIVAHRGIGRMLDLAAARIAAT